MTSGGMRVSVIEVIRFAFPFSFIVPSLLYGEVACYVEIVELGKM